MLELTKGQIQAWQWEKQGHLLPGTQGQAEGLMLRSQSQGQTLRVQMWVSQFGQGPEHCLISRQLQPQMQELGSFELVTELSWTKQSQGMGLQQVAKLMDY